MSIDVTPRWQDEELSMFRDSVGRELKCLHPLPQLRITGPVEFLAASVVTTLQ